MSAAFGPYEVLRPLGQGGMGKVFEVRHPELPGRRLALKLLLRKRSGEEHVARFLREAELLARVRHRGVVTVHATGTSGDGPWMVMDLVKGRSLAAALEAQGPLPPRRAAEVALGVAQALSAVHAAGVVHRDLKPSNVILAPDGAPVLIDFGLARADDLDSLTRSGVLVGSPVYMSPEQVDGSAPARVGPHTDVWGLGALLFALLCGRAPFADSRTLPEVLKRITREEPAWPRDLDPGLLSILRRALSKRPEDRQPDGAAVAAELRAWLTGDPRPGPRSRLALTGALLLAGALYLLPGWSSAPRPDPPGPVAAADSARAAPPRPETPRRWRLSHPGDPERVGVRFLPAGGGFLTWAGSLTDGPTRLVEWRHAPPDAPRPAREWPLPNAVGELAAAQGVVVLSLRSNDGILRLDLGTPGDSPTPLTLGASSLRPRSVSALALSPDGRRLALAQPGVATGLAGATLTVLELRGDQAREAALQIASDPRVEELLFAGERLVLATQASEGLEVLSLGTEGRTRLPAAPAACALARDPQGQVWVGSRSQTILALDPARGWQTTHTLHGHGGQLVALSLAPADGRPGPRWLVSLSAGDDDPPDPRGARSRELRMWSPDAQGAWRCVAGLSGWPAPLQGLDVSPDGEWILVGHGGAVELWSRAAIPALPGAAEQLAPYVVTVGALEPR